MKVLHSASAVGRTEQVAVAEAFERNFVGSALVAERVESRLRTLYGTGFAKLMNSGSNAMRVALKVLSARHAGRDEVLVSGYVCTAVVNAILSEGLVPVFVDVNCTDLNLDPDDLAQRIGPRSLAIVATNLAGNPDRLPSRPGIPVILDACQSIGARLDARLDYHEPEFILLSFGPTKFLTGGIGGALLTSDAGHADEAAFLTRGEHPPAHYAEHGFTPSYDYELSAMDALVIDRQLDKLDGFLARRRWIASTYDTVLSAAGVQRVSTAAGAEPNHYRYYFLSDAADAIVGALQAEGVDARRSIAHNFAAYRFRGAERLPNLAVVPSRLVSLPIHPSLDDGQVTFVGRVLAGVLAGGARA